MDGLSAWLATVAAGTAVLAGRDRFMVALRDHQRRRQPGGHPWRALSRRLGLRYRAGLGATSHRLDGACAGRVVRVSLRRAAQAPVHTAVAVVPRMPLSSELLRCGTGAQAADAGLLSAGAALAQAAQVEIAPMCLRLSVRGVADASLPALVTELAALCLALEGRSRAPWRRAAQEHGLSLLIVDEERALSGARVAVRVRAAGAPFSGAGSPVPVEPGALRDPETVIRVAFPPIPGLLIRLRRPGDPPGRRLGQAVLDGLLFVEAAQPLPPGLRSPAACETLLSVLHAWPGSAVRPGAVELRVPGRLGSTLSARIAEASAVAALLGDQGVRELRDPG